MEAMLRYCFRVLDGGKYSGIVAGGQSVGWLIQYSRALAEAGTDLAKANERAVLEALDACKTANDQRNELVHSIHFWPGSSAGEPPDYGIMMRSRKQRIELAENEWTIGEIQEAAWALIGASELLRDAVDDIAGVPKGQPDWMRY
jgi:hypothetical protein